MKTKPITLQNIETKEIRTYSSRAEAARHIGCGYIRFCNVVNKFRDYLSCNGWTLPEHINNNVQFGNRLGHSFPKIINKKTGEIVSGGDCISDFTDARGIDNGNFTRMLQGQRASCAGWMLYETWKRQKPLTEKQLYAKEHYRKNIDRYKRYYQEQKAA